MTAGTASPGPNRQGRACVSALPTRWQSLFVLGRPVCDGVLCDVLLSSASPAILSRALLPGGRWQHLETLWGVTAWGVRLAPDRLRPAGAHVAHSAQDSSPQQRIIRPQFQRCQD